MAENYKVQQGDCIHSIAFEKGFFADTIWNHPNNAELKNKRKDPNVLLPGDEVFIPDLRIREVSEATNQVYKYRCKNTPDKLKLQLQKEGEPRANEDYVLEIDGKKITGKTDSQGKLEHSIPPNAKVGKLTIGPDKDVYDLAIGKLDPNDEITGAQGRLRHLGFYFGSIDGKPSPEFVHAVQAFQCAHDIEPNGELTSSTKDELRKAYGG